MKRILSLLFLLVITLASVILCGCSKENTEKELLMLQPSYVGDMVTDPNYAFKKEDFKVYALYDDSTEEISDFTFEVVEQNDSFFTILFRWNGYEEEYLVSLKTTANE